MDSLSGLLAFVRAAEANSFVAASERLGVSASAISKSVARLEADLGVRLFNRSTRRLSLTEEGALFFERGRHIVEAIQEAESELSRLAGSPSGTLKISVPAIGYRMLKPVLPAFLTRYPDIRLDIDFNDRLIDIIAEGVDAAIRSGDSSSSQLKARSLGTYRFVLVGAPSYFTGRGTPQSPVDLARHQCLRYKFPTTGQLQAWRLGREWSDASRLPIPSTHTFNSVEALISASLDGLGIAYLPGFAVREPMASGALVSILDDCVIEGGQFSILWPGDRYMAPKLRVFIDFLIESEVLGEGH
ncbi:LysR family transcriptional regulator [Luteibacter sahnii]|uniref:LysR family transcriptional regulator n=1 Tax=Luteibacter sahnii TaxID=3021977 RepID=UPI002A6B2FD8|nr:LysR family transcriptional regulator [Luteibacter sp. PPL193]MDY1549570.1 LysR family transcriptional regulator [Luteibacter sp. PPL193]